MSFLSILEGSHFTATTESSLRSQRFTAAVSSITDAATSSSRLYPSSNVHVVTTPYSALSFTQKPTTSEIVINGSATTRSPSSISMNVSRFSRETSVTSALNSTQQSEVSSATAHSQETTASEVSQSMRTTAGVSSKNVSETSSSTLFSSGVPVVTSSFVVLSSSPRPTLSSANVSRTGSLQTHPSSAILAVTSSSTMTLSYSLRPSSPGLVISSSVIAIPPGIYIRFGISVPLNQSVKDASFKQQLEKGIFLAYKNGSAGGLLGNVSVMVS